MIRNNIKKIMIVIMCIVFLLMFAILVSDEEHLLNCHDEHCEYCAMIHYVQNIVDSLVKIVIIAFLSLIAIYYAFKIFNKICFISQTLIDSKVQLNE